MYIPHEARKLKQIREELGCTQSEFAQMFNMTTTADIERGRTKITGKIVMVLLKDHNINPLWLYGQSKQKHLDPLDKNVTPKTICLNESEEENILLVPHRAAAGYAGNLGDEQYYKTLSTFTFPLPEYRNDSYRAFQIEGHSMYPAIGPDDWIIAKSVHNIRDIGNGKIYVIIEREGIRIKKIIRNDQEQVLTLLSINEEYEPDFVKYSDVQEVWAFHSKLTQELLISEDRSKLDTVIQLIKNLTLKMDEQSS